MSVPEKLAQMREDAMFDISGDGEAAADCLSAVRDRVKSTPAPPSAPKVFLSNDCVFNCAYCGCRSGVDKSCYRTEPRELAELAVREAYRNRMGVFLTSAIHKSPDHTQELIIETMRIIRRELGYRGYIHAKVMPGADSELIRRAGFLANRLSVNIEVARGEGYSRVAKNKNKRNILKPMRGIRDMISNRERGFATSQTTQLMAGSTGEDDFTILRLADALYRKYNMKRVYYTSFNYKGGASGYDGLEPVTTPQWRKRRLYQADRLMELYGFAPEEIAPEAEPLLARDIDPKSAWALRNLRLFPVEVNTADYGLLIRVPGIGATYAKRIVEARRLCGLSFDSLERLGIPLRRCAPFLTCNGAYRGRYADSPEKLRELLSDEKPEEAEQLAFSFVVNSGGMVHTPPSLRIPT
jgi:predicted DNA-binding helix-hairpin-helix protein